MTNKQNDLPDGESSFRIEGGPEEICFIGHTDRYCVCYVDMVDSTKITLHLGDDIKVRSYYTVFLNSMAKVAWSLGAIVVKVVRDGLIFYFPETADAMNKGAFARVLECSAMMLGAREEINGKLLSMQLPPVSYRISADYGKIDFASSKSSATDDLYGPAMSVCSKINCIAVKNGMVIGGDLYRIMKSFKLEKEYDFHEVRSSSFGFKFGYPVYAVEFNHSKGSDSSQYEFESCEASGIQRIWFRSKKQDKGHATRIMLVDDNEDMLFTFECYLAGERYYADVFSDPDKAIRHFSSVKPHYYKLVILDLKMPYLDGIEVHHRLKAIDDDVRVLFVSALDASSDLVSAIPETSAQQLIRKPVDKDHFIRAVNAAIS